MNNIVFVPNLKTNTYVPLVDVEGNVVGGAGAGAEPAKFEGLRSDSVVNPNILRSDSVVKLPALVPSREDPKQKIYNYYNTAPAFAAGDGVNLPEDRFIQYYYACLSIIGLYIVYRISR